MSKTISTRSGTIVDVVHRREFKGTIHMVDGRIVDIVEEEVAEQELLMPGFVDAHIHIESSMLPPTEFARLAVPHGTVATVSDPHEIANVLGMDGMGFMLDSASQTPLKICFGAPSCVPATQFETAGAEITVENIRELLENPRIGYLSEMMNFPGVLNGDATVMQKIAIAQELGKPVDGHAPGLRGEAAQRYIHAGISTDHECFSIDEALEKVKWGMKILIREGSAARNFEALHPLLASHPEMTMFCSDDRHPDSLVLGHINESVKRALGLGYDLYSVLRAACLNPVEHYKLSVGLLQKGDAADFIVVDSWGEFNILETFIDGSLVAKNGLSLLPHTPLTTPNRFVSQEISHHALRLAAPSTRMRVIDVYDGQLVTTESIVPAAIEDGAYCIDTERDILKMVVCNRYEKAPPAVAFIHNIGLKRGALASSVAHDSHNIVAVGCSDAELQLAIQTIMNAKGGVCVVEADRVELLPLPIAGLMSDMDGYEVARQYASLDRRAQELGSRLRSPFMSLSFMALLVIPELKLSDKGLFDGRSFSFCEVAA